MSKDLVTTLRWADTTTAARHPLPCQTDLLNWQPTTVGPATGKPAWTLDIALPTLAADSLVVPSLSIVTQANYQFCAELHQTGNSQIATLPPVPSHTSTAATNTKRCVSPLDGVSTHIDYFCVTRKLRDMTLRLTLWTDRPPHTYLISVSMRAIDMAVADAVVQHPVATPLITPTPPRALSQRQAPQRFRGAICSPTATTMAIETTTQHSINWPNFVCMCRDRDTGLYGVWPLNLHAASRLGHLGNVETFSDWQSVEQVLRARLPVVASIRYAAGDLTGAPQAQTGGHLVLVHGLENSNVLVYDPAAANASQVPVRYTIAQFAKAWLQHRGAAYIVLPKT